MKGYWHQCLEYGEQGAEAAHQLERHKDEAWILVHMQGYLYANRLAIKESVTALRTAVEILATIDDPKALSEARRNLGRVYRKSGDFSKAKVEYNSARGLANFVGDNALIALAVNEIGKLERDAGNYKRAKAMFELACAKVENVDNSIHSGILCNLAGVEISLGEIDVARQHSMDSLSYFSSIDNHEGIATAKWRMAVITESVNSEIACQYAKDAYYLFHKLGMKDECTQLALLMTKTC